MIAFEEIKEYVENANSDYPNRLWPLNRIKKYKKMIREYNCQITGKCNCGTKKPRPRPRPK